MRRPLVLAVDDTPASLQMLCVVLDSEGVDIAMASSGPEALASARSSPPNLILLDVMMPGMDGLEVCRELKRDLGLSRVPVIFLTALADTEHIVEGFAAGCVDYVSKPFREAELRARVRTHLELNRLRSLLPICSHCHAIRDEDDAWIPVATYISKKAGVNFSHGICPSCLQTHYPGH